MQGLVLGDSAPFSFLNLSNGDAAFQKVGGNMTQYLLDTYDELSHTRRAAVSFEDPQNPVVAFSSLLEAAQCELESVDGIYKPLLKGALKMDTRRERP